MTLDDIEFLNVAESELFEAITYYSQEREGLGFEFAAEVRRTLERIIQFPDAWTPLSKRSRRCLMNRFPYGVVYQKRSQKILIIAIMHLRRDPEVWKSRI